MGRRKKPQTSPQTEQAKNSQTHNLNTKDPNSKNLQTNVIVTNEIFGHTSPAIQAAIDAINEAFMDHNPLQRL